jgi:hypothetical protein
VVNPTRGLITCLATQSFFRVSALLFQFLQLIANSYRY